MSIFILLPLLQICSIAELFSLGSILSRRTFAACNLFCLLIYWIIENNYRASSEAISELKLTAVSFILIFMIDLAYPIELIGILTSVFLSIRVLVDQQLKKDSG